MYILILPLFFSSSFFLQLYNIPWFWMYQGLLNQLLLIHWSYPFHATTNNTKHNYVNTLSSFLNVSFMMLWKWCRILDYCKVTHSTRLRSQLLFSLYTAICSKRLNNFLNQANVLLGDLEKYGDPNKTPKINLLLLNNAYAQTNTHRKYTSIKMLTIVSIWQIYEVLCSFSLLLPINIFQFYYSE